MRDVNRQLSSTVFQEVDRPPRAGSRSRAASTSSNLGGGPQRHQGTHVVGKIINPTSVTHEAAQFSVRVGDKRATFTLPAVPPGVAQPFDATLPDVAPAAARKAFFALDGSTISFASSTTRKRAGGDPVDTDRLLK